MKNGKKTITPARNYVYVNDLCVITSYFNPVAYKTKKQNYEKFLAPIHQSKLNYVVVECALVGHRYELPKAPNVIRVRASSSLWQKERLLNIALEHVPKHCTKIAWIDSDVLFSNSKWAKETSALLDDYPAVQPFQYAVRLPKNRTTFRDFLNSSRESNNGFAFIYNQNPNALIMGNFNLHGHTGFAWAARKSTFKDTGFYDACISGSGDHLMAHSFCGDWHSPCLKKVFLDNKKFFTHYANWSEAIYSNFRGRINYTKGAVLHLWHGELENRKYMNRMFVLNQCKFDPETDLYLNESKCWELNKRQEKVIRYSQEYFAERKEDG